MQAASSVRERRRGQSECSTGRVARERVRRAELGQDAQEGSPVSLNAQEQGASLPQFLRLPAEGHQ